MSDHIHYLAVTSESEKPLLPLTRKRLPRDAVRLVPIDEGDHIDRAIDHHTRILEEMIGLDTDVLDPDESFGDLFETLAAGFESDLENGDTVAVNLTGLDAHHDHAFTTAVNTLALEQPEHRSRLSVYTNDAEGNPRRLPIVPSQVPTTDVGRDILRTLAVDEPADSITGLARELADGDLGSSFRSKVQYNAQNLEQQGYIERVDTGYNLRPRLTPMGRLWVGMHE